MTNEDAVLLGFAAGTVAVGVAWSLLLSGCVRTRGRDLPGWRWLTTAGVCGAAGAGVTLAAFYAAVLAPDDDGLVVLALAIAAIGFQLAALLTGAWGLRRAWRAAEGWAER